MADETTLPGLVDPPPGIPSPTPVGVADGKPAGKPKPKNLGGRRSAADEVDAYLRKHGLVTVPSSGPAVTGVEGQEPGPMVPPEPFDEAGTRVGIEGLVNGADAVAVWHFERRAKEILNDDKQAKKIGEAAAMSPPTRTVLVNSALEVARKHGVNVGPEAGLAGALMQWTFQLRALYADLERLARPDPPHAGPT
jgi:hypothetical protein